MSKLKPAHIIVAEHEGGAVGVRANDGNVLDCGSVEGKDVVVVLEQHDSLARILERKLLGSGSVDIAGTQVGVRAGGRRVEDAQAELHTSADKTLMVCAQPARSRDG